MLECGGMVGGEAVRYVLSVGRATGMSYGVIWQRRVGVFWAVANKAGMCVKRCSEGRQVHI